MADAAASERFLDPRSGDHLVRLLEVSLDVQRRHHFFNWASNQVHALAPHRVLACGHYQRQRGMLLYDCFNNVPLSAAMIERLSQVGGELLRLASAAWIEGFGNPLALELTRFGGTPAQREAEALRAETGCELLMVHGVSRPQRLQEIECLFVFASPASAGLAARLLHLELIVPTLQAAWLRVQAKEREMRGPPPAVDASRRPAAAAPRVITDRESEILGWVREGLSNRQIAERLGISPLTVKNHVQKLLRKLGAGNRAQAVALAMTHNLLQPPVADDAP